jgi:hypothetical protein
VLAVLIALAAGYGVLEAWSWPAKAALFPLVIGIPLAILAVVEVAWALLGTPEAKSEPMDFQMTVDPHTARRTALAASWMLGFFAAIVLLGFPLAVPLFVLAYLRSRRESWRLSLAMTLAVWGVFYGLFDRLLHLPFPAGWLLAFLR